MANPRTPYELRFYYTVQSLQHVMRWGCDMHVDYPVGTAFAAMQMRGRNATLWDAELEVTAIAANMQPLFGAADDISHVELWQNDSESDESNYISSYSLNLNGTSSGGVPTRQVTFTYRSEAGGVVKLALMEINNSSDAINRPPYANNGYTDFAQYPVGGNNTLLARDGSFAFLSIGYLFTQNEALYQRRFRPR